MTQAGTYRRRVDVEKQISARDSAGGLKPTWVKIYRGVPCSIAPYRSREFFSAQMNQNDLSWRVMMRHLPHIDPTMRLVEYTSRDKKQFTIYNIEGVLPDPTNRRDTELSCRTRSQQGFKQDGM